jgi:hypothetical protein
MSVKEESKRRKRKILTPRKNNTCQASSKQSIPHVCFCTPLNNVRLSERMRGSEESIDVHENE